MPKEAVVFKAHEMQDGDMQEVVVGEAKVLVVRLKGRFYAIGSECTHYGGPLIDGALSGRRVVCPWHQAVFDVMTGNVEEPPALDAEPCYAVRVEDGNVIVRVPDAPDNRRIPAMVRRDPADPRTFVILGAGAAGNAAVETLRQDGFSGRLVMITSEAHLPYDRPNLSKGYLSGDAGPDSLPLRTAEFYRDHDIEVLLERPVTQVEPSRKTLTFHDGSSLAYDALLLATGGLPRHLPLPGGKFSNVVTLRNVADADALIKDGSVSKVVVIGAGFIGMEAAASLTKRGLAVTVVGHRPVPLERQLGAEIGGLLKEVHSEHGVTFRLGRTPVHLEGSGRATAVVLDDGEVLAADLVLVGLGVKPATWMLMGVPLNQDGSLSVDSHLRVSDGFYAAGDVARFPDWRDGAPIRIEHWRLAEQLGRVAAHNLAGRRVPYAGVPFFWSEQFDLFLQYVGYAATWDDVIFHGDLTTRNFLAYYVKGDRGLAAAGLQHDRQLAAISELMRLHRLPSTAELRQAPDFDPVARLKAMQT